MPHRTRTMAGIRLILWALTAALICGPATASDGPGGKRTRVADAAVTDLAWLAGCWGRTEGEKTTEECWMTPAGGVMPGVHRDVEEPDRAFFEYLRLARDPEADGRLTYFASPLGRPATAFRLVELGDQRAVFANPAHDFPQRILYWLDAEGVLHARVEGEVDGRARATEWQWARRPSSS